MSSKLEYIRHANDISETEINDKPNLYKGNFKNQINRNKFEKKNILNIFLSNLIFFIFFGKIKFNY